MQKLPPDAPCTVDGCEVTRVLNRWRCQEHEREAGRASVARNADRPCIIDGCENPRLWRHSRCRDHRIDYSLANVCRRYGLTPERHAELFAAGVCDICGNPPKGHLYIDHDHACCDGRWSCGECVRGVLCGSCNLALGHFKDDAVLLQLAIEYLGM